MWRLEDLLGDQRGTSCSPGSMLRGEIVPLSEEDWVLSWGNEDPPWSGMERVRALGRGQGGYPSCWRGVVGSLSSAMDSLLPWQVVIEWSSLSCWWLSEFELSSWEVKEGDRWTWIWPSPEDCWLTNIGIGVIEDGGEGLWDVLKVTRTAYLWKDKGCLRSKMKSFEDLEEFLKILKFLLFLIVIPVDKDAKWEFVSRCPPN